MNLAIFGIFFVVIDLVELFGFVMVLMMSLWVNFTINWRKIWIKIMKLRYEKNHKNNIFTDHWHVWVNMKKTWFFWRINLQYSYVFLFHEKLLKPISGHIKLPTEIPYKPQQFKTFLLKWPNYSDQKNWPRLTTFKGQFGKAENIAYKNERTGIFTADWTLWTFRIKNKSQL